MPSLNYASGLGWAVESGEKKRTIRPIGKRKYKAGDRLYHYEGMRTKNCRKLGESICTKVSRVEIRVGGVDLPDELPNDLG